jgi:hypothetical protein
MMYALVISIDSVLTVPPGVLLGIAPAVLAAIISGVASLGSAAIKSGGDKDEDKRPPPPPAPPQVITKGSEKDDTVKAVLIENIKNEREAKHALASAEKALTRETTKDIAETSAAQ